jgi:hypothetical protein
MARDPVAAEYYFWEMIRKGLEPSVQSYENLLGAYMLAQSVGAKKYGSLGRYSRPIAKPLSGTEQAMVDVGPKRVAEISKFYKGLLFFCKLSFLSILPDLFVSSTSQ